MRGPPQDYLNMRREIFLLWFLSTIIKYFRNAFGQSEEPYGYGDRSLL
jgi:hypothetical protein